MANQLEDLISERVPLSEPAPLAFLYEHPQWFNPLFSELKHRGVAFDKIFIPDHFYGIGKEEPAFKVLFNRMSPSANSRDHGSGIFHTLAFLEHLELKGVRVLNGVKAFRYEISKAAQHSLLQSLGIKFFALAGHSSCESGDCCGRRPALSNRSEGEHRWQRLKESSATTRSSIYKLRPTLKRSI